MLWFRLCSDHNNNNNSNVMFLTEWSINKDPDKWGFHPTYSPDGDSINQNNNTNITSRTDHFPLLITETSSQAGRSSIGAGMFSGLVELLRAPPTNHNHFYYPGRADYCLSKYIVQSDNLIISRIKLFCRAGAAIQMGGGGTDWVGLGEWSLSAEIIWQTSLCRVCAEFLN